MMSDCKYIIDEICVNADCPTCADYCPVELYEGECKHFESEGKNERVREKG